LIERENLLASALGHWRLEDNASSAVLFLARFLERRPYTTGNPEWNANASTFLNQILDTLGITSSSDRLAALQTLCGQIVWGEDWIRFIGLPWRILDKLDPKSGYKTTQTWATHLLPASILLGKPEIYGPLLPFLGAEEGIKNGGHDEDIKQISSAKSCEFGTPVYAAIMSNQKGLLRRLIAHDIPFLWAAAHDALLGAVRVEETSMLEYLLSRGPPRRRTDLTIHRAIIKAAILNRPVHARMLIDHLTRKRYSKSRFKWVVQWGLYHACVHSSRELGALLISHGADPAGSSWLNPSIDMGSLEGDDTAYETVPAPVCIAAWAGDMELLRWLMTYDVSLAPAVTGAILADHVDVMKFVNGFAPYGEEARIPWLYDLHDAARVGAHRVFRYLVFEAKVIDLAAEFEKPDAYILAMMNNACKYGHVEIFDAMVEAGVPVDPPVQRPESDWTPILSAHSADSPELEAIRRRLEGMGVTLPDISQSSYWSAVFTPGKPPGQWKANMPRSSRIEYVSPS